MEDLIGRLVANVGVDRSAAEKSVGIILDFLLKDGPADKVKALIDKIPGAEALAGKSIGRCWRVFDGRHHGRRYQNDVSGTEHGSGASCHARDHRLRPRKDR